MTDYEDLAFEPPLKYEDLKKWALENGGEIFHEDDFVMESKNGVYYVSQQNGLVGISFYIDVFYKGTPAQVKRVLEAMLND